MVFVLWLLLSLIIPVSLHDCLFRLFLQASDQCLHQVEVENNRRLLIILRQLIVDYNFLHGG